MPRCVKIKRKKRQYCIGDMGSLVTLQNRAIQPPVFGDPDFDEKFTNADIVAAAIDTVSGKTFFDGISQDTNITHEIGIMFDPTVTSETWIELEDGRRLDILKVENLDERSQFLKLICTDRGAKTSNATRPLISNGIFRPNEPTTLLEGSNTSVSM